MMKEKFTTIVPQTKTPLYVLDMVYDGRSVFIASDSGLYTYNKVEQSMALFYKGLIIKVTLILTEMYGLSVRIRFIVSAPTDK